MTTGWRAVVIFGLLTALALALSLWIGNTVIYQTITPVDWENAQEE